MGEMNDYPMDVIDVSSEEEGDEASSRYCGSAFSSVAVPGPSGLARNGKLALPDQKRGRSPPPPPPPSPPLITPAANGQHLQSSLPSWACSAWRSIAGGAALNGRAPNDLDVDLSSSAVSVGGSPSLPSAPSPAPPASASAPAAAVAADARALRTDKLASEKTKVAAVSAFAQMLAKSGPSFGPALGQGQSQSQSRSRSQLGEECAGRRRQQGASSCSAFSLGLSLSRSSDGGVGNGSRLALQEQQEPSMSLGSRRSNPYGSGGGGLISSSIGGFQPDEKKREEGGAGKLGAGVVYSSKERMGMGGGGGLLGGRSSRDGTGGEGGVADPDGFGGGRGDRARGDNYQQHRAPLKVISNANIVGGGVISRGGGAAGGGGGVGGGVGGSRRENEVRSPTRGGVGIRSPTRRGIEIRSPTRRGIEIRSPTRRGIEIRSPTRGGIGTGPEEHRRQGLEQQRSVFFDHRAAGSGGQRHVGEGVVEEGEGGGGRVWEVVTSGRGGRAGGGLGGRSGGEGGAGGGVAATARPCPPIASVTQGNGLSNGGWWPSPSSSPSAPPPPPPPPSTTAMFSPFDEVAAATTAAAAGGLAAVQFAMGPMGHGGMEAMTGGMAAAAAGIVPAPFDLGAWLHQYRYMAQLQHLQQLQVVGERLGAMCFRTVAEEKRQVIGNGMTFPLVTVKTEPSYARDEREGGGEGGRGGGGGGGGGEDSGNGGGFDGSLVYNRSALGALHCQAEAPRGSSSSGSQKAAGGMQVMRTKSSGLLNGLIGGFPASASSWRGAGGGSASGSGSATQSAVMVAAAPLIAPSGGTGSGSANQLTKPGVSCRQFWRAGEYLGKPTKARKVPAIAELLDNAIDEVANGATFVKVDKVYNPRDNHPALLIQDDGGGMDPEGIRRCMSLGYSCKNTNLTIGQYGNGFKTSTMRLGADVIVFTRSVKGGRVTQSIGMLSYTFLRKTGHEDIIVPMVDYEISAADGKPRPLVRSTMEDWMENMDTLLEWAPYSSEEHLLQQFQDVGWHGTKMVIYNMWLNDDGQLELDFDADLQDIQLRGDERDGNVAGIPMTNTVTQQHVAYRYKYSLRVYASILYLKMPENFHIVLRGVVVEPYSIAADVKYPEYIIYKPHVGGKEDRENTPFWRVWNTNSSDGRGVVGVLEANFIEPAHDKQDFERTSLMLKLETRLRLMAQEYWKLHCHLIGYQRKVKPRAPKALPAPSPPPEIISAAPLCLIEGPGMGYENYSTHQPSCNGIAGCGGPMEIRLLPPPPLLGCESNEAETMEDVKPTLQDLQMAVSHLRNGRLSPSHPDNRMAASDPAFGTANELSAENGVNRVGMLLPCGQASVQDGSAEMADEKGSEGQDGEKSGGDAEKDEGRMDSEGIGDVSQEDATDCSPRSSESGWMMRRSSPSDTGAEENDVSWRQTDNGGAVLAIERAKSMELGIHPDKGECERPPDAGGGEEGRMQVRDGNGYGNGMDLSAERDSEGSIILEIDARIQRLVGENEELRQRCTELEMVNDRSALQEQELSGRISQLLASIQDEEQRASEVAEERDLMRTVCRCEEELCDKEKRDLTREIQRVLARCTSQQSLLSRDDQEALSQAKRGQGRGQGREREVMETKRGCNAQNGGDGNEEDVCSPQR
ncbi:hypothetical protein CBR_g26290 [Chara braunii]|uniref:Morc S5 domain-containing protein n=1 Tax=Chara braunii TaxID=69332 RepID=A0A388L7H4_CHABU|nr:hypothetical protein CBR_g26290 [Chara braunii]|eukprot:GBG78259.1 hypothetical protein CBR_g26290 [Chara braunii]